MQTDILLKLFKILYLLITIWFPSCPLPTKITLSKATRDLHISVPNRLWSWSSLILLWHLTRSTFIRSYAVMLLWLLWHSSPSMGFFLTLSCFFLISSPCDGAEVIFYNPESTKVLYSSFLFFETFNPANIDWGHLFLEITC